MKKIMRQHSLLLLLALLSTALPVSAEISDNTNGQKGAPDEVSYAPLLLLTNGEGKVVPLHDGEMLQVGREFAMTAVASAGFTFTNWEAVDEFTFVINTRDFNGTELPPITNTIVAPTYIYSPRPALKFTMQAPVVFLDIPGVLTVTFRTGWQANFLQANRGDREEERLNSSNQLLPPMPGPGADVLWSGSFGTRWWNRR
jgi:hypothetical protein